MERDERDEIGGNCADCGAPMDGAVDRSYPLRQGGVLCFRCAVRRGGSYDAEEDRWRTAPSVNDLEQPWSPRR